MPLGHSPQNALILGNSEFGEVYHAALAMIYDPHLHIEIEAGNRARIFFRFLDAVDQAGYQLDRKKYALAGERVLLGGVAGKVAKHRRISKSTTVVAKNSNMNPGSVIGKLQELMVQQYDGLISSLLGDKLSGSVEKKVLVWIRNDAHNEPVRNTTLERLMSFTDIVRSVGCQPVYIGARPDYELPGDHRLGGDLVEFFKEFKGEDTVLNQLSLFKNLKEKFGVVAQIGMQSGGMDGPAFFVGIPTLSMVYFKKWQRTPKLSQVRHLAHYHTFIWTDRARHAIPEKPDEEFRRLEAQFPDIRAALRQYTS